MYIRPKENSLDKESTILTQHILVLDETTGEFKVIECEAEKNIPTSDYSGLILDDQTGLFIEQNDYQNSINDLSSWSQPSTRSYSDDSNHSDHRNNELDDGSGLITKRRRKKGQPR